MGNIGRPVDDAASFKTTVIGELPSDWHIAELGNMATLIMGQSPPSSTYNTQRRGLPFLQGKAEFGSVFPVPAKWCDAPLRIAPRGSILVSVRAPVGDANLASEDCCIGRGLAALVAGQVVDTTFLFFNLRFARQRMEDQGTGSTFKSINKGTLKAFRLPIPPLPEQRAIARVLRTVQEAIEATERVIETAKELKRSMMEYLFTYGPVPVDQADQVELKETDAGTIPSVWRVASLEALAREPVLNGLFVKRERFGSGSHFVNVADTYKSSRVLWASLERVQATNAEMDRYKLIGGDLLYVRSSLKREGIGNSILVEAPPSGATFDCHLIRVRLDTTQALPAYVNHYSRSARGKQGLIALSKTTTMTTINQKTLGSFRVPLSMRATQEQILRSVTATETKAAAGQRTLDSLKLLFKGLLHNLMTGKVRVTPTEQDMEGSE